MKRRIVVLAQSGGYSPLGQGTRGFETERRLAKEQDRLRRQMQSRHQPGQTTADDDGAFAQISSFEIGRFETPRIDFVLIHFRRPASARPKDAPAPRSADRELLHAAWFPASDEYSQG